MYEVMFWSKKCIVNFFPDLVFKLVNSKNHDLSVISPLT